MTGGWAIAAGHPLTAGAGAEVLRAGGTAADAAIAAAAMAMVAEPVLAGLFGGGFLLLRDPAGRTRVLDMFVDTPRAKRPERDADIRVIEADFGETRQAFHIGAGTIAVSGLAAGLGEAHARAGRTPMAELLAPAAAAARAGVEVSAFQARLGRIVAPILTATPAARAIFCAGDAPLGEGARHANTAFGDVLEVWGREGARFVQEGEVAAAVLALAGEGGHLTRADLAGWRAAWREPLEIERSGARIALNPPPALGGALTGFPLGLLADRPWAADFARVFAETARAREASGIDAAAASGEAAAGAARLLALMGASRDRLAGGMASTRGTTHISAIDREGAAAALTLSNGEGCGLVAPGTGIMPNNMLGEDDLVPDGPMAWAPGRRLSSMMAPMAVSWPDGRFAVMGSGGSNRIRTALAQVASRVVGGARLAEAIAAPRLHVEGVRPPRVDYEREGLAEAEERELLAAFPEARGWAEPSMFYGGVHAALREARGALEAAGDARRAGAALSG